MSLLCGERHKLTQSQASLFCFNPRSRTGSDYHVPMHASHAESFNPRSRAGSDGCGTQFHHSDRASIHAPVRGATFLLFGEACRGVASIHAPVRGATILRLYRRYQRQASIHAPARGATCASALSVSHSSELQSTLPHGERRNWKSFQQGQNSLQSTLPHGERRPFTIINGTAQSLQSTLPRGERRGKQKDISPT